MWRFMRMPSVVGPADGLPGHAEHVGEDRSGKAAGREVIDQGSDLLLYPSVTPHQFVQASQPLAPGDGRCLLRR